MKMFGLTAVSDVELERKVEPRGGQGLVIDCFNKSLYAFGWTTKQT